MASATMLMAMKRPIASKRTVSRYYYSGKGYANRGILYRAIAKKMLKEMVFKGVSLEMYDIPHGLSAEEERAWSRNAMDAIFAKHFPHEPGCTRVYGGCRGWEPLPGGDGEAHHDFQSCRYAQTKWIEAKAKALRAYDDALAKDKEGEGRG
jgi:hypothetical protein